MNIIRQTINGEAFIDGSFTDEDENKRRIKIHKGYL